MKEFLESIGAQPNRQVPQIKYSRLNWPQYFMTIAHAVKLRSHDEETQVGCVIIDRNRRLLSAGYNGHPPGANAELPTKGPEKYRWMIHAELNAIAACASDTRGATLYCTHSPCSECAKVIAAAGIRSVYFNIERMDFTNTQEVLQACGVLIKRIQL